MLIVGGGGGISCGERTVESVRDEKREDEEEDGDDSSPIESPMNPTKESMRDWTAIIDERKDSYLLISSHFL